MTKRPRVALVRGAFLNVFECQTYAVLAEWYDITAFGSVRHLHALTGLPFPTVLLPMRPRWPQKLRWAAALAADLAARARFGEGRYLPGLVPRLADFDLVHSVETTHGFSGQAVAAKRQFGCRVVVSVSENLPFNRKHYSRYAFEAVRLRVLAEADAFLAVTERARETLVLEGADPARIRVVPHGVDLKRFRPAPSVPGLRQRLGLPADGILVLAVGTMSAAKGLPFLLHAVRRARLDPDLREVDFTLVLVGRDIGGARDMIVQLGLEQVVRIVPYVPYADMPPLYNLAALTVLPSVPTPTWQEQFGMVLAESLASSTPILSTTTGSIPEIVGDAGVLVPPADHIALYRGLKELLLDSARRESLGRAGRQRAEALFDRQLVAKQIRDLYASLL